MPERDKSDMEDVDFGPFSEAGDDLAALDAEIDACDAEPFTPEQLERIWNGVRAKAAARGLLKVARVRLVNGKAVI